MKEELNLSLEFVNPKVLRCSQIVNLQQKTVYLHSPDDTIDTAIPPIVHPNTTIAQTCLAIQLQQAFDGHYRYDTYV